MDVAVLLFTKGTGSTSLCHTLAHMNIGLSEVPVELHVQAWPKHAHERTRACFIFTFVDSRKLPVVPTLRESPPPPALSQTFDRGSVNLPAGAD